MPALEPGLPTGARPTRSVPNPTAPILSSSNRLQVRPCHNARGRAEEVLGRGDGPPTNPRAGYPSPGTPVAPPTHTPPCVRFSRFQRRLCPLCTAAAEQTFNSDGVESRGCGPCDGRSKARAGRRRQQHSAVVAQPFPHGDACGAKKATGPPVAVPFVRWRTADGTAPGGIRLAALKPTPPRHRPLQCAPSVHSGHIQ